MLLLWSLSMSLSCRCVGVLRTSAHCIPRPCGHTGEAQTMTPIMVAGAAHGRTCVVAGQFIDWPHGLGTWQCRGPGTDLLLLHLRRCNCSLGMAPRCSYTLSEREKQFVEQAVMNRQSKKQMEDLWKLEVKGWDLVEIALHCVCASLSVCVGGGGGGPYPPPKTVQKPPQVPPLPPQKNSYTNKGGQAGITRGRGRGLALPGAWAWAWVGKACLTGCCMFAVLHRCTQRRHFRRKSRRKNKERRRPLVKQRASQTIDT